MIGAVVRMVAGPWASRPLQQSLCQRAWSRAAPVELVVKLTTTTEYAKMGIGVQSVLYNDEPQTQTSKSH